MRALLRFGIIIVLLGLLLTPSAAAAFYDVPASYKHAEAIGALAERGWTKGYADNSFKPENPINRAEAVKLLVTIAEPQDALEHALDAHRTAGHAYANFKDMPLEHWAAPGVEIAFQKGWIKGYPDGKFHPETTLNFAEGLKMILETQGADVAGAPFEENPLLLVGPGDWFAPYFMYAASHNVINTNKFYDPSQRMTRGEFAETLYRLKTVQENNWDWFAEGSEPASEEYTITIPKLNVHNVAVSFADPYNASNALAVLKEGFGNYLLPPGSQGRSVLFGHSSGYSWDHSAYKTILRQINQLQEGDRIYINYREKGYVYVMKGHDVIPAEKSDQLMHDSGKPELAIYTCWPPDSITYRYVVYAQPL